MTHTLSRRLFYFLIVFTPLAFGTVEPWSYAVMEITAAIGLFLYSVHIYRHRRHYYAVPGIIPLTIFLFYILFQIIPLPGGVIAFLSPKAFSIHQTSLSLTDSGAWMTLSVYPRATLAEFFRIGTYVLFYILTVQLLTDKTILKKTIFVIIIFGALLSFSSILQHYTTENRVLWFRPVPPDASLFGPYLNRNHYAGLMEMIFPIMLGMFFFYRPRINNTSFLKGVAEIFNQEKANIHILIGFGAILVATSIFISLSRSGIVSACIALFLFTLLLLKRGISKGNTLFVTFVLLFVILSVSWFGWDQIFNRFGNLQKPVNDFTAGRQIYWNDTANIIRDFSVTGSGLGTFRHIFPSYQTIVSHVLLTHAHNDYLEIASEGGLISILLAGAFLFVLLYRTYPMFLKRRDAFAIYLYMGCITGLFSILLHSFTDFNLHIGANGLWFFFLAGLAVSASHTNIRKQTDIPTRLLPVALFLKNKAAAPAAISIIAILVISFNISNIMGRVYYDSIKDYQMSVRSSKEDLDTVYRVAARAAAFDPLDGKYPFTQALAAWFLNDIPLARNHFSRAVTLDPANSRYLERFGFFLARQDDDENARRAFEAAVRYDISESEVWLNYGAWLLMKGEKQKGVAYLNKAVFLDDRQIDRVLTAMAIAGMSFEEMEQAVPRHPASFIAFAKFLDDTGRRDQAKQRYIEAMEVIENNPPVNRAHFHKIYQFFMKKRDIDQAMQVLLRAEAALPYDVSFKIHLGDLYQRQGISFKAREKYEQALILDPKNKGAMTRLQRLSP